MFKKVSKLMLLAVSALMVFSACTDTGSGDGSVDQNKQLEIFIAEVGGKEFQLPTGGAKHLISATTGDITATDGTTMLYKLVKAFTPDDAVYTNGDGNYFGVTVNGEKFDFYFAKVGGVADYWATADEVKNQAGADVLLAAKTPNAVFVNGPFTDNVTNVDSEVPALNSISAKLSSDFKLYALAQDKAGNKGTLFTGTIDLTTMKINIAKTSVAIASITDMLTDALQLIGGATPVIIDNADKTDVKLYKKDGTAPTSGAGESASIRGVGYAAGAEHVAIDVDGTNSKLHKISATGIKTVGTALNFMTPTSVVAIGTTNILVSGVNESGGSSGTAVIDNVTLGDTGNTKVSIPVTGLPNTSVINGGVKLAVYSTDIYAVVEGKLYKFNGTTAWTVVTAIDNAQQGVTLPTTITSVDISGSVMYITELGATTDTSTTTAYLITPTMLVKISPIPSTTTGTVSDVDTQVNGTVVSLPMGLGVLVIDVEKFGGTAKVLRYNQFMATDAPFQMPTK